MFTAVNDAAKSGAIGARSAILAGAKKGPLGGRMTAFATAGAGFLLAVLWFDLMFDVQTRRSKDPILPPEVLRSISAYYRRVTTDASPMSRLVAAMMLVTVVAIGGEIALDRRSIWMPLLSLGLTLCAVGLAGVRTVRNAVRLGRAEDLARQQSALARSIFRDHVFCFAAMAGVLALQLTEAALR